MSKILFILPAASIYDNQKRVMGWRETPSSRTAMKALKELVPRLKELGPTQIVGSDLDHDSVWLLAQRLRIPYAEWRALRRLNAGKMHGAPLDKFEEVWASIKKPEVPVKGGDSPASYAKRMANARDLLKQTNGTVVVVADERTIQHLVGGSAKLERGRVYECQGL